MPITREVRSPARLTDPEVYDLSRPHGGERLILWRHRQPSEVQARRAYPHTHMFISQAEAARRLGMDPYVYNRMENRGRTMMSAEEAARLGPMLGAVTPTVGEMCFLARRRSGERLATVYTGLGVSKVTFYDMERRGDPAVVEFWEARGFRFSEKKSSAA